MATLQLARADRPLSGSDRFKLLIHRALDKHLSPLGVWFMRRTQGSMAKALKVNALLLTTRGRRSRRERTVVLQYFPDGDSMVVVAANDGGAKHPGWYFNLAATPTATVEVGGEKIPVTAAELDDDESARWWQRILEVAPDYKKYRRATTRTFPILRLTPTEASSAAAAS